MCPAVLAWLLRVTTTATRVVALSQLQVHGGCDGGLARPQHSARRKGGCLWLLLSFAHLLTSQILKHKLIFVETKDVQESSMALEKYIDSSQLCLVIISAHWIGLTQLQEGLQFGSRCHLPFGTHSRFYCGSDANCCVL